MARRRMIDPEFWIDSRNKKLNYQERLFVIGMINHADDEGRLLADPALLRSKILRCSFSPFLYFSIFKLELLLAGISHINSQ